MPEANGLIVGQGSMGICGFASMLQLMLQDGKSISAYSDNDNETKDGTAAKKLAKKWISDTEHGSKKIPEVVDGAYPSKTDTIDAWSASTVAIAFTGTFLSLAPYNDTTVDQFLDANTVNGGGGLAMRAECIAHLGKSLGGYSSATYHVTNVVSSEDDGRYSLTKDMCDGTDGTSSTVANSIVGITVSGKELLHWVFVDKNGFLYTWDKSGADAWQKLNDFTDTNIGSNMTDVVVRVSFS